MPLIKPSHENIPRNHVHIAVLDTDVPCPAVYAKRGLHSSRFRTLLQAAAKRLNQNAQNLRHGPIEIHVTAFDVVGGSYPPLSFMRASPRNLFVPTDQFSAGPIDVILVTGAAAAAYDNLPWIPALRTFIQTIFTEFPFVKIYGSCFGHQLIGQALLEGQKCSIGKEISKIFVEPSIQGHEIGVHPIILNTQFSSRFSSLDQFSKERPVQLQVIHGDIVTPSQDIPSHMDQNALSLPDPWMNIGNTSKCLIQGLFYPERVLTLQGHFEFDAFATGELCRQFGRTFNWTDSHLNSHLAKIWGSVDSIDGDCGPYDDSQAIAELAVLFFADEDRLLPMVGFP
ncbi:uncharacterized protein N7469_000273 [Penicillium citrinum]|uniref:Class I glutamine amidotransferase-like protein n=1 Tax=Penicillium citrinum TaxID=5077 RepID=A0A9W9TUJ2_PENCI|nr:uncharacterized protein N7469_000273 [Penicillium citrinum]KAJ5241946.1 hypothetical protein N7469_000273 [Penicillium citrinum]